MDAYLKHSPAFSNYVHKYFKLHFRFPENYGIPPLENVINFGPKIHNFSLIAPFKIYDI